MEYKRVLTIQDISCVGQCSLTVALPVLSACGLEACVLPSAVLSSHTAFPGATFRDLTEDMPKIAAHWKAADIRFDAVCSGYLGSTKQMEYVADIFETLGKDGCVRIVDPAMADHGKLYRGFEQPFVEAMKDFCVKADYLMPNVTEACLLTDTPYREVVDKVFLEEILRKLLSLGPKCVILTGAAVEPHMTGVAVAEGDCIQFYSHEKMAESRHGTGDLFAAVFTGALMRGKTSMEAARMAGDFVAECIRKTLENPGHWYGTTFELALPKLIRELGD